MAQGAAGDDTITYEADLNELMGRCGDHTTGEASEVKNSVGTDTLHSALGFVDDAGEAPQNLRMSGGDGADRFEVTILPDGFIEADDSMAVADTETEEGDRHSACVTIAERALCLSTPSISGQMAAP